MPTKGRLIIYSAVAATFIYLFTYYRKRTRGKKLHHCDSTHSFDYTENCENLPEHLASSAHIESCACFASAEYHLPKFVTVSDFLLSPLQESNFYWESISVEHHTPQTSVANQNIVRDICFRNLGTNLIAPVIAPMVGTSVGSGSESDRVLTPDSNDLASSPDVSPCIHLPPGGFNDPTNDIYEADPEELGGKRLPTVLIPSDMWAEVVDKDIWHETFYIPAHMGGVLIGRLGKNVRELKNAWQAEFSLNTCPGKQDTLLFKLSCPLKHKNNVLHWVSQRFRMRPSKTTIGNPNQLKRYLPLGEPVPVHIRSLYGSKELFVTIPDEEYERYVCMQSELDKDYSSVNSFRTQLCEPVTSGTVAVVPLNQGFARALIISVYSTWPKTVFYFLLDHGTFGVVALNKLRKIRAKYMQIPFQAIHVSWAHAYPVFSDIPDLHLLRTFFNSGRVHAFAVRMETCCRSSVAFGESYPQPYSSSGFLDILLSACNTGLFMAVPLLICPKRQAWLNGTQISYYPFTYSAINYQSLVSFAVEDEAETLPYSNFNTNQNIQNNHPSKKKLHDADQGKVNKSGDYVHSRAYPGWINRGRMHRGVGTLWNSNNNRQNSAPPNSLSSKGTLLNSQKENQYVQSNFENTRSAKFISDHSDVIDTQTSDQRRKPLSVRNNRGSGINGPRTIAFNRGRGFHQGRY